VSAISETFVREYFEMHGFLVRQQRKFVAPNRREDEEFDFFVLNPGVQPSSEPMPFVLGNRDLMRLGQGVVVVKGWHTETFTPGLLAHAPEIYRFVEPCVFQQAVKAFGNRQSLTKILVVPALPQALEAREESIQFLRAKGVDAVIPFSHILTDLLERIEVNRNYQKSDLLQVLRILKNYGFVRDAQMELFGAPKLRARRKSPAK